MKKENKKQDLTYGDQEVTLKEFVELASKEEPTDIEYIKVMNLLSKWEKCHEEAICALVGRDKLEPFDKRARELGAIFYFCVKGKNWNGAKETFQLLILRLEEIFR